MTPTDKPESAAQFGRWSYTHATGKWWWSEELLTLTGTPSAPDGVEHFLARMPSEGERESLSAMIEGVIAEGGSIAGQFTLDTPQGHRVYALVGDTLFDEEGRPSVFRAFSTDVTGEVRLAMRAAVDAATRHRRAIEQVKGALMVTYRIDEVTAFAILRQQSNMHNVKLNVLAEHVSRAMASGPRGGTVPLMELLEGVARKIVGGHDDLPPGVDRIAT